MTDLYKITRDTVEPASDLLECLVKLNWHAARARDKGWSVTLSISNETGDVTVLLDRDTWPSPPEPEATA